MIWYFIREGEPTAFFAGVIKGKVSVRKTHIFNKITKQIEIKPLFKIVSFKSPQTLGKSDSKARSRISSFKKKRNSVTNKNYRNSIGDNENYSRKESLKKYSDKSLNNFSNKDRNIKIVKENYDLDKYELIEEELFRRGEG